MALLEIKVVPDPVLRRKAHKVTEFGQEFQKLVEDMIETLRDAPGVGLAAPQVGLSERLVVIEYGDDEDESVPKKLYVLVNPEIIATSEEMEDGPEGCLSVPELIGNVERYKEITVKGLNRYGKPAKWKVDGWTARIFQHEMDHLDGILFTDRTDDVWKPRNDEEAALD